MRLTLMHNPEAGDDQPSRDDLVALLRGAGHDVRYQSAKDPHFAAALEDPGEAVLVAGGDGTVAKVAKRMVGRDIPLAILPLGTSNNIARSLGLHGTAREVVEGLPTAVEILLDVGRVSAPWGTARFIEAAGIGFFGSILRRAEERREREAGDAGTTPVGVALRGIRRELERHRPCDRRIDADGEDLSGSYLMVEVMNIRAIGPRMAVAPDARVDDGSLDLVLLREADRSTLAAYLTALADGGAPRFPIPARRVRRVSMSWDMSQGHVDDEVWPERGSQPARAMETDTVEVGIVDPPLRVLVPRDANVLAHAKPAEPA